MKGGDLMISDFILDNFDAIMNFIIGALLVLLLYMVTQYDMYQSWTEFKVLFRVVSNFSIQELVDVAGKTGL